MATFYIQLENRLLQISGELTAENISKALGYVPVSPNVTNELSQKVDNITFDSLKDNPFLQDGSGELNIVDEAGNIIAKVNAEGIHSVDFIAGEHRLSNKTDKTYVDEAIKNVKVDLTGYATEEYVNNIDFYNINNNPIINNGDGKLLFVDENGYIGLQLEEDGLYIKDVIADGHTLSQKADKSDLPTKLSDLDNDTNYITLADIPPVNIPSLDEYVTEEELNSKGYITQHQDISHLATKAEVSDIDFYNIKNNPVINSETGKLLFVDESGNIGLQLEDSGLFVADVFAGSHVLSNKADKSEVPTSTSQLTNDSGYITKPVVDQAIASLVDSAPETLDTIGEIASALKNNADIVDVLNQSISTKQNTIEDLEAIRAGAAKGATSLQEIPEEYAKKEDIPSLNGYATQAWVNNKNYATEEDLSSIEFNSLQNNPLVEDSNGEFNLVDDLGNVGFKVNEEGLFVKDVIAGNHVLSNKANVSDIPESITESTVSGWGFTKNTGTVNGVKINGTTKNPSSGVVDLGTVITSHQDISGKQDKLVSGTNIKTINGTSILGDGDLSIQYTNIVTLNIGSLVTLNSSIAVNFTEDQLQILRLEDAVIKLTFNYLGKPHVCTMFHTINGVTHMYSGIAYMVKNSVDYDTTKRYVYGQFNNASNTITFTIGDIIVTESDIKTINGQSLIGSGDITISGGASGANVQAVDTGDVLDDITVDYATKTYVDGLVGDINSVLESIING